MVWTFSTKLKFIEKCFGRAYIASNQKNVEVRCFWCDPKDLTKKKLSIRIADDAYNCWVCGEKGRSLWFPIKMHVPEHLEEYVNTFMPGMKHRLEGMIIEPPVETFKLPKDFKLLAENLRSRDPDIRAMLNYVRSRGLDDRDLWYHKIGTSNDSQYRRRVIVPSFDVTGKPNFMVGRTIDVFGRPKYQVPQVERRDVVFNEINVDWKKQVVLCEGAFDAIKCGENAIPLLGSSLNENSLLFERIVVNNCPVIVMLDADMIEKSAPRLTRKLQQYQIDAKIVDLAVLGCSDPGSMSKQEVQDAIGHAKTLDWFDYTMNKLNVATRMRLT